MKGLGTLLENRKDDEAIEVFKRYLEIELDDVDMYLKLSEILRSEGKTEERASLLETGLVYVPGDSRLLKRLASR